MQTMSADRPVAQAFAASRRNAECGTLACGAAASARATVRLDEMFKQHVTESPTRTFQSGAA